MVGNKSVSDCKMVWEEILIEFTIAGFISLACVLIDIRGNKEGVFMMFKRVRDILKILEDEHNQINLYYEHLSKKLKEKRLKLILDHVIQNKNNFKNIIEKYEREGQKSLLDTWIQFFPEQSLKLEMDEIELRPDMSIDEVMKVVIDFDGRLENYFRYLSETTKSSYLKIVFGNFSDIIRKQKLLIVSSTNLLQDI